jgi:magnesium transporter
VDRVWANCQRDERHLKAGADHLLYELADAVVADYMLVVDEIDEVIDQLEGEVFDRPTPSTLERIFKIKRAVLNLRRIVSPQREVLNRLARDDYPVIDAQDRVYFRDVYDHLVRLYDINESLRDLVGGALDTYLSVMNNNLNEVMKTLTIITTMFMPISFAAGFFGMNFFQPVEEPLRPWTTNPAFVLAVLVMFLTPIGMYLWVRRKGWM